MNFINNYLPSNVNAVTNMTSVPPTTTVKNNSIVQ